MVILSITQIGTYESIWYYILLWEALLQTWNKLVKKWKLEKDQVAKGNNWK